MRISTLATSPGGVGSSPAEVPVVSAWGPVPGRQFRAVRYLGFSCGSLSEGISLVPASAALRGEFLALDYDALHPPAPLAAAEVREDGDFLVVELGGVRRIRRVVLARSARTEDGTLGLFRLDGDRPAAAPTVTVEARLRVAGIELRAEEDVLGAAADLRRRPAGRAAAHETAHAAAESEAWRVHDTVVFDLNDDFDDARFALRVTTGGDGSSLGAADLAAVTVRSAPANARLGLSAPPPPGPSEPGPDRDPLSGVLPFWPDPTSLPAPSTTQVDAGALLAFALATHLARRTAGAALPARVDVALVVAADAPCRFRFDALDVGYHLERASLEPPREKAVLRFPPGRVEAQEVAIAVPRGASVVSVRVEASESRVGAQGGGTAPDGSGPPAAGGGLLVTDETWAGRRLDLADAALASGLTLGLLGLAEDTELAIELRADAAGGVPTGQRLASASAPLGPAGRALWVGVAFGAAVLLPSGPVWVCVRASRGRAVWLAGVWDGEGDGAAGARGVRLTAGTEEVLVLRGAEVLCFLHAAAGAVVGAGENSSLRLEIDGVNVLPGPPAAGRVVFDATAALGAAVIAAGGGTGSLSVPVRFAAEPGAVLTVYPPRVVYDL